MVTFFKCYFLCHINPPSKRFSQVSIATFLFSIFIVQNAQSTAGLNINSILEGRLRALLKMFLIDVGKHVEEIIKKKASIFP